jgi:hypothetical protein
MALVVKDRVQETSTTTGTGTLTLAGAATGFQSFSVIGNANTTYYAIVGGAEFEVGLGTYTSSGTTLSRDTVLESSNAGSLVNFSAGTKNVFVTYPAEKSLYLDASNNAIGLGTVATTTTLTNATGLPISTGVSGLGTNVATFLATPTSSNLAAVLTDETGTGANVFATSPTLTTPVLGTPSSGTLTSCTGLPLTTGVTGTLPIANGGTGTTSTTFTNLTTNVTGTLPVANGGTGITSLGTGVATFLGTPSSSNLASAVTDETGSGSLVFGTSPTVNNPTITNYVESVVSIGTVTTSNTLSLTNGTVQTATLTASTACTFTMPTATAGKSFILLLKQAAATGNGTATFTGVKFNSVGAPTITATAGKMDILSFVADGTNWYGSYTQGYTP